MIGEIKSPEKTREKIKSRGYWEVIIRPTRFEKERINDLSQCLKITEHCRIKNRGWDYPHIANNERPYCGIDYFESVTDWDLHKEFWRMYQSGQFVHLFGIWEDWFDEEEKFFGPSRYSSVKPGSVLEVIMTLYSITEIYQFASKLAMAGLFDDSVFISIKLHGLMNRKLECFDFLRRFYTDYFCRINTFPREKVITVNTLVNKFDEIALDETLEIFKRFNWNSPPREAYLTEQRRFLEGKK